MPNIDQSKLTTLEQLRIDNRTLPAPSAPIKYNEVYGPVTADALVGIFVRSTKHRHLLFGMGVRAMVLRELGVVLPLVVLPADPASAMQPVLPHQLVRVVRSTPFDAYNDRGLCFPIDITGLMAPADAPAAHQPPPTPTTSFVGDAAGFDTSGNGEIDAWYSLTPHSRANAADVSLRFYQSF